MDCGETSQFEAAEKSTILINVGGFRHETHVSTLKNIPDTRLYWIAESVSSVSPGKREFFYDRHPGAFAQILNYYRTGKLHYPTDMCGPMFEEELMFWGIDEKQMEPCCWATFTKHREAEENLKAFVGPGFEDLKEDDLERSSSDMSIERKDNLWKRIQQKIWNIMDEPHSSKLAKAVSYLSCFFISLSIAAFCTSTLPGIRGEDQITGHHKGLEILEIVCSSFFTLEFLIRVIFCPTKIEFFKKPMNWIDLISILPFYVSFFFYDDSRVKMVVVIRVLRLFRFVRLSYGLQIMIHTLKASSHELVLLLLILLIPVVMFSSIVYYIEIMINKQSLFSSVPQSFWWCLITMTTVGYGDLTPQTWPGKIIGGACAVCGVLIVALPISVIGSNFSLYYAHAQARLKLPMKQHRLVLGGVPGLLTKHQELSSRRKKKSTTISNQVDMEMSAVTERTSLRSSMPHSPLLELRRASNRNAHVHDSETELIGADDERSISSPLLRPSPQLQPRGPSDKVVLGSRRRPRKPFETFVPRKSEPQATEAMDLQQTDAGLNGSLRVEQGITDPTNSKLGSDMINVAQRNLNQPITAAHLSCRTSSPDCDECVKMDIVIERPVQAQPRALDTSEQLQKENQRPKWFYRGKNSLEEREKTSKVIVNGGDTDSTCSSKRPSLESCKGSCDELNSNQSTNLKLPLKTRKSFSDSLLCTVPQNDHHAQKGDLFENKPLDSNNIRTAVSREPKRRPSADTQRKANSSKLNGSLFTQKKVPYPNGPCWKHGDEDTHNNQRERTSTHPCYDPMDLPKKRRNAECTVTTLPQNDTASDNDFLETKI